MPTRTGSTTTSARCAGSFGQSASPPPADPSQTFSDREQSYAGYVKANFGFDIGSLPVDGNIGLRVIDTGRGQEGLHDGHHEHRGQLRLYLRATDNSANTVDWLPSLNARLQLQDDLFLRFAASQTVTHPTFAQLNPGLSLQDSTATLLGSGSEGNPNLRSVKSDNADLSLEYYFNPTDVLTGAVFYRQIDGYIQQASFTQTINNINYNITQPVNAPSGHIDGVEVGYTQFFTFLPGPFSGLGAQANATFVDGNFQNISKWSYNLVGIYEKGPGLAARRIQLARRVQCRPGAGRRPAAADHLRQVAALARSVRELSAGRAFHRDGGCDEPAQLLLSGLFRQPGIPPRHTPFRSDVSVGIRFRYLTGGVA